MMMKPILLQTTENNNTNVVGSNSHNSNIQKLSDIEHMNIEINNDNIELIDINEVDEDSNVIHSDTLLHKEIYIMQIPKVSHMN